MQEKDSKNKSLNAKILLMILSRFIIIILTGGSWIIQYKITKMQKITALAWLIPIHFAPRRAVKVL